jgi:hypothetical protein
MTWRRPSSVFSCCSGSESCSSMWGRMSSKALRISRVTFYKSKFQSRCPLQCGIKFRTMRKYNFFVFVKPCYLWYLFVTRYGLSGSKKTFNSLDIIQLLKTITVPNVFSNIFYVILALLDPNLSNLSLFALGSPTLQ